MPNHPAIAGVVIISVAVVMQPHLSHCNQGADIQKAAAIAVYESPQARQFAEDLRRKIAIALHSLGDEINPNLNNLDSTVPKMRKVSCKALPHPVSTQTRSPRDVREKS